MRGTLVALTLALAACGKPAPPAPPPAPAPVAAAAPADEVVQRVRAATGEVRVRSGSVERRGVGFVVSVGEKHAHVVTDANVTGKAEEGRTATVRFGERVAPAVVAHEDGTWAVLRVERAGETALTLAASESESVFVGAFGSEGFALRATRCAASDQNVWLDDEQDPAAAGAPIVDSSGRLVGALAGGRSTTERLKRARSRSALAALLEPHVADAVTRSGPDPFGEWSLILAARLVDPMGRVRDVHVGLALADRVSAEVRPASGGGCAPVLGDAKMHEAVAHHGSLTAYVPAAPGRYVWQLRMTLRDGSTAWSPPGTAQVDAGGAPPRGTGGSDVKPRAIEAQKRTADHATITTLKVDPVEVVPSMVWSADGRHVYVPEKGGRIRRIALPEMREDASAAVKDGVAALALSREGLLVAHASAPAVSVLDAGSLAERRRIAVSGSAQVASAPALSVAFSTGPSATVLQVVDLAGGRVSATFAAADVSKEMKQSGAEAAFSGFAAIRCTPDGRHLLCDNRGSVVRFGLGDGLRFEEGTDTVLARTYSYRPSVVRVDVSPDGRFVAFAIAKGRDDVDVWLLEINNFKDPRATLPIGSVGPIGVDSKASLLHVVRKTGARRDGCVLATYLFDGTPRGEFDIGYGAAQILVHPDGYRFLALTAEGLLWVELRR